jgi:hypothetical protein
MASFPMQGAWLYFQIWALLLEPIFALGQGFRNRFLDLDLLGQGFWNRFLSFEFALSAEVLPSLRIAERAS